MLLGAGTGKGAETEGRTGAGGTAGKGLRRGYGRSVTAVNPAWGAVAVWPDLGRDGKDSGEKVTRRLTGLVSPCGLPCALSAGTSFAEAIKALSPVWMGEPDAGTASAPEGRGSTRCGMAGGTPTSSRGALKSSLDTWHVGLDMLESK